MSHLGERDAYLALLAVSTLAATELQQKPYVSPANDNTDTSYGESTRSKQPKLRMKICLYTETALPLVGGQELVVDTLA